MIMFLSPGFAWMLVIPAAMIVLYLLKRKYVPRQTPSVFLWQKSLREQAANKPFQKLKKNILLVLQVLTAVLLALALMRPAVTGGEAGRTVFIFDVSGSMLAQTEGKSRLERAKVLAVRLMRELPAGEEITILTAGTAVRQVFSASDRREEAERAVAAIENERGGASLEQALSVAEAIQRQEGSTRTEATVWVFSDLFVPGNGVGVMNAAKGADNRAISSLTAENDGAFIRVANYGAETTVTLTVWADGQLINARELALPEGESIGAAFTIPDGARRIRAEIREGDALPQDNMLETFVKRDRTRRIALVGDNVFIESALKAGNQIQVIRTTEEALPATEADLYIRGTVPLIISRDPEGMSFSWGEKKEAEQMLTADPGAELTRGLGLDRVSLRSYYPLSGGQAALRCGEDTVMAVGEREAAIGFDLHDSNLPLKYDFPILIQKLTDKLLPDLPEETDPDEEINAEPMPREESDVRIVAPSVEPAEEQNGRRMGTELKDWLLLAVFLMLLAEWGVSRYVR